MNFHVLRYANTRKLGFEVLLFIPRLYQICGAPPGLLSITYMIVARGLSPLLSSLHSVLDDDGVGEVNESSSVKSVCPMCSHETETKQVLCVRVWLLFF